MLRACLTPFVADRIFALIIGLGVVCPILWILVAAGCYWYVQTRLEKNRQLKAIGQYFPKGFATEYHQTQTGEDYIIVKAA